MKYFLLIIAFFALSCNTILLINKSKVVHEIEGYLLYYRSDKSLFIPSKDTSITSFFKDTSAKKGYLLQSACGISGLKYVADKFYVDMVYLDNNQEVLLSDSIYFTTTRFRYLLNKTKSLDFSDTLEFKYNGKRYKIDASDSFYGEVLKVDGNAM